MTNGTICGMEYWIADELWQLSSVRSAANRERFMRTVARLMYQAEAATMKHKRHVNRQRLLAREGDGR